MNNERKPKLKEEIRIFRTLNPIMLFALMIGITGCNEFQQPEKTIRFDSQQKVSKQIKTEYNPVVIPKECGEQGILKLHIPAPYPNHIGKKMKWNKMGDSVHTVKVFMDSIEVQNIHINNDFTVTKDSINFSTGYKLIETTLPIYSSKMNDSGILRIQLLSSGELIQDYTTQYFYLNDGDKRSIIKRRDLGLNSFTDNIKMEDYVIKQIGNYMSDTEFTHSIKRHSDKFVSTHSAIGKGIFVRKDNKAKWKLAFDIPELPEFKSDIPLEFELEEKNYTYQSIGYSPLDENDLGKIIVFNIHDDVLGQTMEVSFEKCKMKSTEIKTITIPMHSGWSTSK